MVSSGSAPSPSRYQPLLPIFVVASLGCAVDRYLAPALTLQVVVCGGAIVLWWTLWRKVPDRLAVGALLLAVMTLFGAWHHLNWHRFAEVDLGFYANYEEQPCCLRGQALSAPRKLPAITSGAQAGGDRFHFEVAPTAIRHQDRWLPADGQVVVTVSGETDEIGAGDELLIFGKIHRLNPPDNPGELDYASLARGEGRLAAVRCNYAECVRVVRPQGSFWYRWRESLRQACDHQLSRYLSAEQAGLASAMFLGIREGLEPEDAAAFLQTGTIHLLVVSGLNVAILAGVLVWLLRLGLVQEGAAVLGIALAAVIYTAVVGMQPPVLRATVMVLAYCLARWRGMRNEAFNTLAAAALVVLVLNPCDLFRLGTQLSFLAFGTLVWIGEQSRLKEPLDPLDRLIFRTLPWPMQLCFRVGRALKEVWLTTTLVLLMVTPLVLARNHLITPAALVLGPILSPVVSFAMILGVATMLLGAAIPPVAAVCGMLCQTALDFLQGAISYGQQWRWGHFWSPGPSDWWLIGFYAAVILFAVAPSWRPPLRWQAGLLALWVAFGGAAALFQRTDHPFRCTVLSVGHGTAVVLELPSGKTFLYDAGRMGIPEWGVQTVADYLWWRGIARLDGILLSHADVDHYNAVPGLLERFACRAIYVTPMMFEGRSPALQELQTAIKQHDVSCQTVRRGDYWEEGGARIEILYPGQEGVIGTDNANSLVVAVEFDNRRILLTGDLEGEGIRQLLADPPLPVDVLVAPHHGSSGSDPQGMAAWASPRWVVVSGSRRDENPVVKKAYVDRGSSVLHTASQGAISVEMRSNKILVTPFNPAI